jgi:Dolichyl-phosphate-mannose-protein mannosyltransferase
MWFLPNTRSNSSVLDTASKTKPTPQVGSPLAQPAPQPVAAPVRMIYDESQAFYVVLIFFAAIVLRVMLFAVGPFGDSSRAMYPDSYRYVELGETMVSQGAFGRSGPETGVVHEPLHQLRADLDQLEPTFDNGLRPEVMRTPGYPALLGATAWLGLGINGLLLLQCLFSAASVALVYGVGRALLKRPGPALFAAAIVALHPAAIAAPTAVLTETSFTLLILLGLWSVADRETRGIGSTTFGGLMIGLSVLVRPVSIMLGPAIALWMVVTDFRIKTFVLATLMVALSLAPGAAWMARNQSVGFGYRLSSIPYINTYFYGNAYMRLTDQGGDWKQDWPATVDTLMGELRAEQALNPDAEIFDTMKTLGVGAIRENPALYGRVIKESVTKFFTDHSMGGLYQQLGLTYKPTGLRDKLMNGGLSWENFTQTLKNPSGWLALVWVGFNGLLLVGMILGAVMLLVRGHWSALLLLGGVMFYFTFATQTTGLERFRLPVLGIQTLLVASLFAPRLARAPKAKKPKRRWYEQDEDQGDSQDGEADSNVQPTETVEEPEPEALARPI